MIRSLSNFERSVFLTFDDGPKGESTKRVLDVLAEKSVPATFFLIGKELGPQRGLVDRMVGEGHALGNHSWDHAYSNYFSSTERMKKWVTKVSDEFRRLDLPEAVGFRPPAGVVTPPVRRALSELREPLVLWNERFFDSVFEWGRARAERSARLLIGGSVVLLHDAQRPERIDGFCRTLEVYIDAVRARGFDFAPLTREICLSGEGL